MWNFCKNLIGGRLTGEDGGEGERDEGGGDDFLWVVFSDVVCDFCGYYMEERLEVWRNNESRND